MKAAKSLETIAADNGVVILKDESANRESVSAVGLKGLRATVCTLTIRIPARTQRLHLHRPNLLSVPKFLTRIEAFSSPNRVLLFVSLPHALH